MLEDELVVERAAGVMTYIRSYRVRGHVLARLDPLTHQPSNLPELDMANYGLTIWDKDRTFYSDGVTQKPFATLREIQETLRRLLPVLPRLELVNEPVWLGGLHVGGLNDMQVRLREA